MEKENNASGGGGEAAAGATSNPDKLQADQANPLLDPTAALFGGECVQLAFILFTHFYVYTCEGKKRVIFEKKTHNTDPHIRSHLCAMMHVGYIIDRVTHKNGEKMRKGGF